MNNSKWRIKTSSLMLQHQFNELFRLFTPKLLPKSFPEKSKNFTASDPQSKHWMCACLEESEASGIGDKTYAF
jgi:hypothetical protein